MVLVYVWKPPAGKGEGLGHASIRVSADDIDGRCVDVYMSWWPSTPRILRGTPAYQIRSYKEDVDDEGRAPDLTFTFDKVFKESVMLEMWERWRKDVQYQVAFRNCSTLVKAMMCNSGLGQIARFTNFCSYDSVVKPDYIQFYSEQLQIYLAATRAH
jgi:hypothetical protein